MGRRKDFTKVDNSVVRGESADLSHGAFRLYVLLCSYCYGDKATAWPGQDRLGEQMGGVCRRTLRRYAKELEKAGLVRVQRNIKPVKEPDGQRHRSNTYIMSFWEPWDDTNSDDAL